LADLTRRSFLKILGAATVGVAVASKIPFDMPSWLAKPIPQIVPSGEIIQVVSISGTMLTVTRGYGGTVAHPWKTFGPWDTALRVPVEMAAELDIGYLMLETTEEGTWQVIGTPTCRNDDFAVNHDWHCGYCRSVNPVDKYVCLLYTSPSPRDLSTSRMPSSA